MNVIYWAILNHCILPLTTLTVISFFVNVFRLVFFFSFFQIRLVWQPCMAVIRESSEWALEFSCFGFVGPICSLNLGLEMNMSLFYTYFLWLWLNLLKCIMGNIRFSEPTSKLCIHSYLYIDYFHFLWHSG